nr:disease resistance protein RPV1-like [Ziziphus jujuba var. spinosa]
MALFASTSSSSVTEKQHDVFLSFRGIDTRNSFTGHLYSALQNKGIKTFIDREELGRGENISSSLIKAITESKICIIVFSKNYASSTWCLDELLKILECRESLGQLVWPVFFNVKPSEVRNCAGSYEEAMARYEQTLSHDKEKLCKWKVALNKASNLSGWHLAHGDESQLIKTIVKSALRKLNRTPLHVAKYPVGMEDRLHELSPIIDVGKNNVRIIGIYGIGGIGKTTIAKAIYNKFADEFECSSFLADVKEISKQHLGLAHLQEMLLFDILGNKNLKVGNIHRGVNIIKERLCHKRVLLVLDDVDELDQLEKLAGGLEWFGSGSRIIITTRNKQILTSHGADEIYEVQRLDNQTAIELLSWNAFKKKQPVEDYLLLSNCLVDLAGGIPLDIEILGTFLSVGIQSHLQKLHPLINVPKKDKVRFIGICGSGGIGKTTIAKACFNKFTDEFEGSSFLANVKETAKNHSSLVKQQEIPLFDMLVDKNLKVGNTYRGINIIRERLCHKRVFLILDDVGKLNQLKTLAGGHEWFTNILDDVGKLNQLKTLAGGHEWLGLGSYANGLPLALEVLGSFLCGRGKNQWQNLVHNLENKPHEDIYDILKISYDALNDEQKAIFLDIACFFVGEDKDYATLLIGSCNLCPITGIEVLIDMSLLTIESNKLRMHHLIEEMGQEIVHQESPEVGKRNRLWSAYDIFHVLSENTLRVIPDLSRVPNLESLHLDSCTSLVEIHESVGSLTKLSFPRITDEMEYLTSIDITGTAIKELPTKFELLVGMGEYKGITFPEKRILILVINISLSILSYLIYSSNITYLLSAVSILANHWQFLIMKYRLIYTH